MSSGIDFFCMEALELILSTQQLRDVEFCSVEGSVNNIIRYVKIEGLVKYVLRIYNNGNSTEKVKFEHLMLSELQTHQQLSFQIPTAIKSCITQCDIVFLSNGSSASLFKLIPGFLPKLQFTRELGRACGELAIALGDITLAMAPEVLSRCCNPPYYELFKVHDAITRDLFYQQVRLHEYDCCRSSIDFLVDSIRSIENQLSSFHLLDLPSHIIHGDLHYDNILCSTEDIAGIATGKVTGILDFEFCAMDWRSMELAICLSKYISEADPMPYVVDFISGYAASYKAKGSQSYTRTECSAMPSLMRLRILSNVVFFVSRAMTGEDSSTTLTTSGRADTYKKRLLWIEANHDAIIDIMCREFACDSV